MNTILIVCDTWRRDHSGAYGNDWIHTPNINRFAEKSPIVPISLPALVA